MKKQIGNDVRLEWTILRKGVAEDFTNATDLLLTAFIPNLSVDEVTIPIARVGNVFTLNIPTTELAIGTYTIRLQYKKPDPAFESGKASISTAVNSAFQIVPIGASEDDLNDTLTSNVVYCTDGATFFPSVSVVGSEVILSWTNDKGYINPLPINIKGAKGDEGKSAYEYYLESTTEPIPLTEAEFSSMLGALPTYVQNAILATNNANNAATNANNAANAAMESAEDANSAAILANNAADNANTKALYAQTQGDYAKAQGDYAKVQGDYAHEQGLMAYTAANEANATNDSVQTAENLRVSTESDRVNAEANRVTQENGRISAESDRVSAENSRVSAESSRVTAENGRVTAESGRVTAENDRAAAEVYRNKYIPVAFDKRVTTDSGLIRAKQTLFDSYKTALDLLPNTLLAYSPEIGLKQSVSGLIYKATKLYDLSSNNNDATQATAANQPYIGGNVAPNEKLWLWGNGKEITFNTITFSATDKWSVSVVATPFSTTLFTRGSSTFLLTVGGKIRFTNNSVVVETTKSIALGVTTRFTFVAKGDGALQVWVNGAFFETLINSTSVSFTKILGSSGGIDNGKLYSLRIFNKDLSKSEIEGLDKFLASIYSEHETTSIGSQGWVTSNHLGNVTSDGFVIPEVQGNDAASNPELITNAADREFTSDTGYWTKGGSNPPTIANGVCNIACAAGGDSYISRTGFLTLGKPYRLIYSVKRKISGDLSIFTTGTSVSIDSTIGDNKVAYFIATGNSFAFGRRWGATDIDIDDLSLKECGWADSQAIYDYYISVGQSVLEATKAASMWCKYNNSDDNAAVYGYLYNWWAVYLFSLYPPKGLRVPTKADFDQLVATLGGSSVAGGKLKKEGFSYWLSPNIGATNESGFTALGAGRRNTSGEFGLINNNNYSWTSQKVDATTAFFQGLGNYLASSSDTAIESLRFGFSLRFLKNAPVGSETQELDTGIFTTDIATSQRELTMSFGHKVTNIKVNSLTNNLTNFKVELRTSAGVLIQTLVQGKSVTANAPIDFAVLIDQNILFQDAKLWITATGNTGATNLGMQVKILTKQNMY